MAARRGVGHLSRRALAGNPCSILWDAVCRAALQYPISRWAFDVPLLGVLRLSFSPPKPFGARDGILTPKHLPLVQMKSRVCAVPSSRVADTLLYLIAGRNYGL